MNIRTIAGVVIFSVLAIALSPILIPAPYALFLCYEIWEIPVVAAFLLYGVAAVILVTAIDTVALLFMFPGALQPSPMYSIAAVLSMILGIGIIKILIGRTFQNDSVAATLYTVFGAALRTAFMTLLEYSLLGFQLPLGFSFPQGAVIANLPLIAVFNLTLALYTVPAGYLLAKIVMSNVRNFK